MKKPLTFAVLALLILTGCGAQQTEKESANSETNTANPFEQSPTESPEESEEPAAAASSNSDKTTSSSAGSDMDELNALLEDDPQVPTSASTEDKKVLEPLMKTYDELNEKGLKLSNEDPDPILGFVDNLLADVDNTIKAKGEQPGSDVVTYTDLYAFLSSNTGKKKLNLEGYNGEAKKHLPLREYIYYSPEMSDVEVAAFNFYWGELMAYTYSADEQGNPSNRYYTDPVLLEGKYQVVDPNTVIINKTQLTVIAKEAYVPLEKVENFYPRMTFTKQDGKWKVDASALLEEFEKVNRDYEGYQH